MIWTSDFVIYRLSLNLLYHIIITMFVSNIFLRIDNGKKEKRNEMIWREMEKGSTKLFITLCPKVKYPNM